MKDRGFPKTLRLRKTAEFDRVFREGRRVTGAGGALVYAPNGRDHPRIGILAGRKLGCAVRRNRARRVFREAFRLHRGSLPVGYDLVVIPFGGRDPWDLPRAVETLQGLARRIEEEVGAC